jgi:CBS domain-containing protein
MEVARILDAKGWDVVSVEPGAMVAVALHEMITRGIGALVVTEDGKRVLGLISERDITRGLARHGGQLITTRVRDVMSRSVAVCRPDDSTTECMAIMTRTRQRHLPVVADRRVCGLVSIGDLVKNRLDELELERNVLREAYLIRG